MSLTCLSTWRVRGSAAAGGVAHTAVPEVGCCAVKMGSRWLLGAPGEKPPFLKKFYHGRLSFRGLVDSRVLFWYKLSTFTLKCTEAVLQVPPAVVINVAEELLDSHLGSVRAYNQVLSGRSLLSQKGGCPLFSHRV